MNRVTIIDTKTVLHYTSVMKNVTITLKEDVAHWARVWAASRDTSVSRMLGEMLRKRMEEELGYEKAMKNYLGFKHKRVNNSGAYPSKEDIHDRHIR